MAPDRATRRAAPPALPGRGSYRTCVLIAQRSPDPDEMNGGSIVTVLTVVDRGLHCEGCGQPTRADTHVMAEEGGPVIATLTGCTACRTGLYGSL